MLDGVASRSGHGCPLVLLGHHALTAELVFLEGEGEHKHNCGDDRQDQEGIQVCQRRCLPYDRSINQRVRLIHGGVATHARREQAIGQPRSRIGKAALSTSDVRHQVHLMDLRSTGNERRHHGCTHAAADIAHEVNQTGDAAAFLGRHPDVRHKIDGYEQKS